MTEMTSKKHMLFVEGPLGGKPPIFLPGIGKVGQENLLNNGITTVEPLLGYYLMNGCNSLLLQGYIQAKASCNAWCAQVAAAAIAEWTTIHIY